MSRQQNDDDQPPTGMDEAGDFEGDEVALLGEDGDAEPPSLARNQPTGLLNQTYFEERIAIPESESSPSGFSFRKLWAFTGPG